MPRYTPEERIAKITAKAEARARSIRLQPMRSAARKLRDAALALPVDEASMLVRMAEEIEDHLEAPNEG